MSRREPKRNRSIGRFQNSIALASQDFLGKRAHVRVILDQQNGLSHARRPMWTPALLSRRFLVQRRLGERCVEWLETR